MKKLIIILAALLLILLSACGSAGHGTPIPAGSLPASTVEAADDIVFTPGGGAYRANVLGAGGENPWPLVPVAVTYWTQDQDTISVLYRPDMDAKAGESHTDIILVSGENKSDLSTHQLKLYADSVPAGITITDAQTAIGRPGVSGTVLVVTVSPQTAPGKYVFDIGIELDGKYYGSVSCTVNVTA
ncbi:MAG: hypothetical protein WC370_08750 [Dehalococcoidales bacterium]|jgi:hypothetical protein